MRETRSMTLWLTLLLCVTAIAGCQTSKELERAKYNKREEALKQLDEGRKLAATAPVAALARFDRAVKLHPTAEGWYEMGRLYEAMGRRNEAASAYTESLKISPDWREARFALLALGYEAPKPATAGEIQEARRWAATHPVKPITVARDETETGGLTAEQIQARRQEVLEDAAQNRQPTLAEVEQAIFAPTRDEQLPSADKPIYSGKEDLVLGSYPYHIDRGRSFAERGQTEQAVDEFQRAMQIDPKQIEPRLALGDMMMKMERYTEAQFHYETARQQFPNSPRPELKLGNLALAMNRRDQAAEDFRRALEKDPKFAEALNNLAFMSMQDKDYTEAARLLDQALSIKPDYPNAILNRGIIASDVQHDNATALRMYRRYVELDGPRSAEVRRWIKDLAARTK